MLEWIYPANFAKRDYQYSIVQNALYMNSLVCLPTGFGKTFIAAVVMFNYYRWFPRGIIIFVAPTKPLVTQQVQACYNVVGIPQCETADLTGLPPSSRSRQWSSKRVFFSTPQQTIEHDIQRGICDVKHVVLLVIDEAHRASGNYAFVKITNHIRRVHNDFRVLALTATPGANQQAVQGVISNLLISHMDFYDDNDPVLQAHSHERVVEEAVISADETLRQLQSLHQSLINLPLQQLHHLGVISKASSEANNRFRLLHIWKEFRTNPPQHVSREQVGQALALFSLTLTLQYAADLLANQGVRCFQNHLFEMKRLAVYQGHRVRRGLSETDQFNELINKLKTALDNGYLHPKLKQMEYYIVRHFKTSPVADTRVIIFTQYRNSVSEILSVLAKHEGLVHASPFVGQGERRRRKDDTHAEEPDIIDIAPMNQSEQKRILQLFRSGNINTLVATCVGEEGLDIGQVDLIINYDSPSSPVRTIQRMGRTGRKRKGRIVTLIMEGKEQNAFAQSRSKHKHLQRLLSDKDNFVFYDDNPRMLPDGVTPKASMVKLSFSRFSEVAASLSRGTARNTKNCPKLGNVGRKGFLLPEEEQCVFLRFGFDKNQLSGQKWGLSMMHRYLERGLLSDSLVSPVCAISHSAKPLFCLRSIRDLGNRSLGAQAKKIPSSAISPPPLHKGDPNLSPSLDPACGVPSDPACSPQHLSVTTSFDISIGSEPSIEHFRLSNLMNDVSGAPLEHVRYMYALKATARGLLVPPNRQVLRKEPSCMVAKQKHVGSTSFVECTTANVAPFGPCIDRDNFSVNCKPSQLTSFSVAVTPEPLHLLTQSNVRDEDLVKGSSLSFPLSASPPRVGLQRLKRGDASSAGLTAAKGHHEPLQRKTTKPRRMREQSRTSERKRRKLVEQLFSLEAEVSGDDGLSSDHGSSGSNLSGFIVDEMEVSPIHKGEQDMQAIYHRSLLSQDTLLKNQDSLCLRFASPPKRVEYRTKMGSSRTTTTNCHDGDHNSVTDDEYDFDDSFIDDECLSDASEAHHSCSFDLTTTSPVPSYKTSPKTNLQLPQLAKRGVISPKESSESKDVVATTPQNCNEPLVYVSQRELTAASELLTTLKGIKIRMQYCSPKSGDYILGTATGVLRRTPAQVADFASNSVESFKTLALFGASFRTPVLLLDHSSSQDGLCSSVRYDRGMAVVSQARLRVVHSSSIAESVYLFSALLKVEVESGFAIYPHREHSSGIAVLSTIPSISPALAAAMMTSYGSLTGISVISEEQLVQAVPGMKTGQARNVCAFFQLCCF
eukprot:Rmarinus@m.18689